MLLYIENIHVYLIFMLIVGYFFRSCIFKKCVLSMFRKSGNICILEKKTILDPKTHELKEDNKEVLNVAHVDVKENVTLYITDPKFYELLFLRGEEGLGEAFIKKYFETDELEDLLQIVHGLNWKIYKLWFAFYSKLDECFCKQFKIQRQTFSLSDDILNSFNLKCFKVEFEEPKTIILHNGLYDFSNTFIQKMNPIIDYREMEEIIHDKHLKIELLKRESNEKYLDLWNQEKESFIQSYSEEEYRIFYYYTRSLRFLIKNNYISFNYLFCKK